MVGGIDWTRIRAYCKVIVAGQDVTSKISPFLIQVQVIDTESPIDTATIELSDRHGVIKLPKINGDVKIELGWHDGTMTVFEGYIEELESHGQRKPGRRLTIHCRGNDIVKNAKQPLRQTLGEGEPPDGEGKKIKLEEAMKKFAESSGLEVKIHKSLGNLERLAWSITNESFQSWIRRMGREVGGLSKIRGNTATMVPQNGGENADGKNIPTVDAKWAQDGNLLAWRIFPIQGRTQWSGAATSWFDRLEAKRRYKNASIEGLFKGEAAKFTNMLSAFGQEQAQQQSDSDSGTATRNSGTGWIVIVGDPQAQALGSVKIVGVRPGIDGVYRIQQVEHTYSRGGGYESRLNIIHPDAAQDIRGDKLATPEE